MQDKFVEQRAEIDEELQQLRQRILTLLLTRNNLAPIACLPSEILAHIFALTQAYKQGDGERFNGKTMLRITSVCQQWRSTALDHPLLWAEINHTNRGWAIECLKRSKKANLKVDVSMHAWPATFSEALLLEAERVQWLSISSYPHIGPKNWSWSEPMPILHTLKLLGFTFSDNLFSLNLPALRDLELQGCRFTNGFPSLSSLTTLAIKAPSNLPMRKLLEALSSAANVVSLELSGIRQGSVPDWNASDLPHVPLLELSTLTIRKSSFLSTAIIIRQVSVPTRAHVNARCAMSAADQEMFDNLFKSFPPQGSHALRVLQIRSEPGQEMRMAFLEKDGFGWVEGGGCFNFSITFVTYRMVPTVLRSLQRLPLNDLEKVSIQARLAEDVAFCWRDIFTRCPKLSQVEAGWRAASAFMDIFISTQDEILERDASQPHAVSFLPYPALEELKLMQLPQEYPLTSKLEVICKVLQARNSFGSKLKSLEIRGQKLKGIDIDSMKVFVHRLVAEEV